MDLQTHKKEDKSMVKSACHREIGDCHKGIDDCHRGIDDCHRGIGDCHSWIWGVVFRNMGG